ncbi:co-chaperone GroES [Pseudoalteromonas umbrosa]|uniref:co-chaperone GroES n=1 Tax=Pseudoalteromonas umbrosa TaxID=3048489 RepID=UPI0024C3FA7D|nr:co-chaperone GroES [Pseudoalteromonas sp. B95]MDK1290092.1 co-chaperone GroES [Pseudoalteromonas sp. B95]
MTVLPLHDLLLVKRTSEDPKERRIQLLKQDEPKPNRGVVLQVGPGKQLDNGTIRPVCVKVGDTVVFHEPYRPHIEIIDGQEALIITESDLIAKLVP